MATATRQMPSPITWTVPSLGQGHRCVSWSRQGEGMREGVQGQVDDKAGAEDGGGLGYRLHR